MPEEISGKAMERAPCSFAQMERIYVAAAQQRLLAKLPALPAGAGRVDDEPGGQVEIRGVATALPRLAAADFVARRPERRLARRAEDRAAHARRPI